MTEKNILHLLAELLTLHATPHCAPAREIQILNYHAERPCSRQPTLFLEGHTISF